MTALLPDVPVIIVLFHLAASVAFLGYGAVTQLRRLKLLRQTRQRRTGPLRLLQVSLGLSRTYSVKRDSFNG